MALHTITQTLKAATPGRVPFEDSRTRRAPLFYHACPVDWTVSIRDERGETITGLAEDYVSAVLKLLESQEATEPLLTVTETAADEVTFSLTATQATLVESGSSRELWAVVYLLTSGGTQVPVACGKCACIASGAQAVGATSDPDSAALTGAEVQDLIDAAVADLNSTPPTFSNGFLTFTVSGHTYRTPAVQQS